MPELITRVLGFVLV